MTDTTGPTPEPWYAVLQALKPSLNQSVTGIAGALVGILTTLGTQWATAAPPKQPTATQVQVRKVETSKVIFDPVLAERLDGLKTAVTRLTGELETARKDYADRVEAWRAKVATSKAKGAAKGKR